MSTNNQYFIDSDDKPVKHIIIEYVEPTGEVTYALWLGDKQVTSKNCNDIFGDGKASYNDVTKVLTLNNPTIPGSFISGEKTVKITSGSNLNIVGSYHMPSDEDNYYGLYSTNSVNLNGDFTFNAEKIAISCGGDLVVNSGSLKAKVNSTAAVSVGNTFKIENGVTKVELEGTALPVLAEEITLGENEKFTDLADGRVVSVTISNSKKRSFGSSTGVEKSRDRISGACRSDNTASYNAAADDRSCRTGRA